MYPIIAAFTILVITWTAGAIRHHDYPRTWPFRR
jgi:hypothetical protein